MSLNNFAGKVKTYLKGAGYSQKILANELGVNSSVLSHKLNGTGRFILTYPDIRDIVRTLAKLEAITRRQEAQELLELANCPGFSSEEWKTGPLKSLEEDTPASFESGNNLKGFDKRRSDNLFISSKTLLTNLPVQLTSFIGREREIEHAKQLLSTTHLLTLAGAGGVGKTRLALQVGAALLDSFKDGVWLVELAPICEPSLVAQAIIQVMELRAESGRSLSLTLVDYFKTRQALLILDNCEHLMDPCSTLIMELLRHCPDLRILTTSRETFEISGEATYRVPSLYLPNLDPNRDGNQPEVTFEQFTQFESVRLFIDRAVAAQPKFRVTNQNVLAIAQICYRLDGIPLAIELAAARISYLSTEQIIQHLNDRFRLLKGGGRTGLPRQQTLRALIDWSYNLLVEAEKVLLRRLGVFAGSWTLEAAEKICSGEGVENYEVLDYLIQLVKKSMVLAEESSGGRGAEVRYRMLETIRQYSLEKLQLAGEEKQVQLKHLNYFIEFAEEAEPAVKGANQVVWVNRLEQEQDNLRAAMRWAISNHLADPALRIAVAQRQFWTLKGYWVEGRKWLETSLEYGNNASSSLRAKALGATGWLAALMRDVEAATPPSQESLEIYQSLGDLRGCGYALSTLALITVFQGDLKEAIALGEEAEAKLRQVDDKWGVIVQLNGLGMMKEFLGDRAGANACYEEGLKLSNEISNTNEIASCTFRLGKLANSQLDLDRAVRLLEESARLYREVDSNYGLSYSLFELGSVEMQLGNYERARVLQEEAVNLTRKLGARSGLPVRLWQLGLLMLIQENYSYAAKLFKESLVFFVEINHELTKKVNLATCLESLAYLAWHSGKLDQAAKILVTAETMRKSITLPIIPNERLLPKRFSDLLQERFIVDLKTHLEACNNGINSLEDLSLDQAIALALEVEPESDEKQLLKTN